MIEINVRAEIDEALAQMRAIPRDQLPVATAKALTFSAEAGQNAILDAFRSRFEAPTPYTLRATFKGTATPANLSIFVGIKDKPTSGDKQSPGQRFAQHFRGGGRTVKGIEYWLERAGMISANERVVPAAGAKLDKYGNLPGPTVVSLMSQIRVGPDPAQYRRRGLQRRAAKAPNGSVFWSYGQHLPRGIYQRIGTSVVPVLIAVKQARYRERIDLDALIKRVTSDTFPRKLRAQMQRLQR